MPIGTIPALTHKLRLFADSGYNAFAGWAGTDTQIVNYWADVADELLKDVIPASPNATAARAAFINIFSSIHWNANGVQLLQLSFMAYAVQMAAGMPSSGFNGLPPPALPPFTLTGMTTQNAAVECANIANVLYAWAHTGTAIPIGGTTPITWN